MSNICKVFLPRQLKLLLYVLLFVIVNLWLITL